MNAPSRRERGAAMLLAFLALLILVVVVGQLSVSANVDRSIALTSLQDVKYDYAARGAWHEACAMLIKDLKDEETEADEEGTGTEGEGTSQFEGSFGGGSDLGEAQEGSATDSLADEWLDPEGAGGGGGGFGGGGGGDLDVRIRIVDEDRKMNLLCLAAKDDGFREEWKERFVRLLDTFREDSDFDLTNGEADDLVDRFEAWLQGDRDHDFPTYAQSTTEEADSKLAFGEARFVETEEDEVFFPLGLDELVAVDDMSEFLLHGFIEDGRYVPGLMDVITVYSNVRIDPDALDELADAEEEDDLGDSPFDEGGDDEQEELEEAQENAAEDAEDEDRATETNQGRVNVNTAPMVVLRALLEQDKMPYTVLEKIDEFRREVLEDHLDHQKGFGDSSPDDFGVDADQAEDLEDQQEEKEEDFVFDNPDGVVERVEDWLHQTFSVGQNDQKEFGDLLSVKSHVFTIFVEIRKQESGLGQSIVAGESYRPPDRVYRGVVWRRKHSDGKFQVITLVPLHPYSGAVPPDTEQYQKDYPFGF
ncbi:MAG: hypothetical protein ACF8XB_24995 [Planctomycetota bacterium JB042]